MQITKYKFLEKISALDFVDEIWLFGSRARGDNNLRSDIDLAILAPNATASDWQVVLNIVAQADTLLKIDCIRFDKLKNSDKLKASILLDRTLIYKK